MSFVSAAELQYCPQCLKGSCTKIYLQLTALSYTFFVALVAVPKFNEAHFVFYLLLFGRL